MVGLLLYMLFAVEDEATACSEFGHWGYAPVCQKEPKPMEKDPAKFSPEHRPLFTALT